MSDPDRRDEAASYVETISAEQVRQAVRRSLDELGMSFQELAGQARQGRFGSNRARLVWMAIADLGHLAEPDPTNVRQP